LKAASHHLNQVILFLSFLFPLIASLEITSAEACNILSSSLDKAPKVAHSDFTSIKFCKVFQSKKFCTFHKKFSFFNLVHGLADVCINHTESSLAHFISSDKKSSTLSLNFEILSISACLGHHSLLL
jgi:hypothetical protein